MVGKVGCIVHLAAPLFGCLVGSVLKVDIAYAVKKKGDFMFWIESDAWKVSLCFRYLYIFAILCNYIQSSLGSIFLEQLLLKLDKLITSCPTFLFGFHSHSPFI